ncbi:hypothetical protein ACFE04_030724 [Oxalis oulophora]
MMIFNVESSSAFFTCGIPDQISTTTYCVDPKNTSTLFAKNLVSLFTKIKLSTLFAHIVAMVFDFVVALIIRSPMGEECRGVNDNVNAGVGCGRWTMADC